MEDLDKYFSIFLNIIKNQSPAPSTLNRNLPVKPQNKKRSNSADLSERSSKIDIKKNEIGQKQGTKKGLNENENIDKSIENMTYMFEDKDTGRSYRYIKVIYVIGKINGDFT